MGLIYTEKFSTKINFTDKKSPRYGRNRIGIFNVLDLFFEISYLAIIFLIPLYFAVWLKNNNVFELNKIILFKILIWLLLLIFLIKIIYLFSTKPSAIKKKLFAMPKRFIVLILFFIVLAISAYFAQDQLTAFEGSYFRQQGLVSYFFYILFFCLLWLNARISASRFNYNKIIIAIVLSSWLVSIYGLAQKAGWDFINWNEPAWLTGRVSSSLGQPNFLASYLLLVIPLSVYLFFKAKKLLIKFFWFIVLISQLLCLFFTYSRGGLIGLAIGLIIIALIYFLITKQQLSKKINFKQKLALFLLLIILVSLGLIGYYKIDFFKQRVKSSFDFQSGSVAPRMNFWKTSLSAIKEKPFFGYGLDNQGEVFIKYYEKDWGIHGNVNDYPDRAHNLILDILLTVGGVGLIFYLLWLFVVFKSIIKNIRENKSTALNATLLTGIICYLLSLMFSFEITTTTVYLWLFFALIFIINDQYEIADNSLNKTKPSAVVQQSGLFKILLPVILIIIISVLIFWRINKNIKYLIADHYFWQIEQAFLDKEYFETYVLYGYLKQLGIKNNYYDLRYGGMLADNLGDFKTVALTKTGQEILEKLAENLKSNNFETFFIKGKIYTALANGKNKQYFILAENNLKQALKNSQELPKTNRALAELYFKKNNYQSAIDYFNQALNYLPALNSPYLNADHSRVIKYERYYIFQGLGDVYFALQKYEQAENFYQQARLNNLFDIVLYKKIADTYYKRGNLDKAIFYNQRGFSLNQTDYNWPLALSILYREKKDLIKAKEYLATATKLAPENEELKKYCQEIDK